MYDAEKLKGALTKARYLVDRLTDAVDADAFDGKMAEAMTRDCARISEDLTKDLRSAAS